MAQPKKFIAQERGYRHNINWHTPFYRYLDFESGVVGEKAENVSYDAPRPNDCFDSKAGNTTYSDEFSATGLQSAKCRSVADGTENDGRIGGFTYFKPYNGEVRPKLHAKRGDTLSFSVTTRFPSGFDFTAPGGGRLKFLRFTFERPDGDTAGHTDIYITNLAGGFDPAFSMMVEMSPFAWSNMGDANDNITRGVFEKYRFVVTFDTIPKDEGGQAEWWFYRGDNLLGHGTDRPTMEFEDNRIVSTEFIPIWNGGPPANQTFHVDNVEVTNILGSVK